MSGVSVTDGNRRWALWLGSAQETFSAAAERPRDVMWELDWWECSGVRSIATWSVMGGKFWMEGRRYL